jgi:uncharacterized protein YaaN involved in tellurite resistance
MQSRSEELIFNTVPLVPVDIPLEDPSGIGLVLVLLLRVLEQVLSRKDKAQSAEATEAMLRKAFEDMFGDSREYQRWQMENDARMKNLEKGFEALRSHVKTMYEKLEEHTQELKLYQALAERRSNGKG